MENSGKTKEQLIAELGELRQHLAGVEKPETKRKQTEEALKLAYAELDQIFDATADVIRVIDKDFNILRANEAFEALSGVSKDEAAGKKCYDVLRCPRCHSSNCSLTQILNGEERIEFEEERERDDGTRISCIVTVTPFRQPDGKVIGIVSTIRDVTKRKQAEEVLKESEAQYSALVETSPDGIIMMQDGVVKFVNTTSLELVGYRLEELTGVDFLNIVSPGNRKMVMKRFADRVAGKEVPSIYEITLIKKDGTTLPVEVNATLTNYEGRTAVLVFIRDITERRRAEKALRESEEKYRTLVEDALIGIVNVDIKGKITYVNKAILQGTGYSLEDLLGKNAFSSGLIHSGSLKLLRKRLKEKLMGEPPSPVEIQFKCKDGKWIWLQIAGKALWKHGMPVGVQIIGENITERRRAEEQLKESESFLNNIIEQSPFSTWISDDKGTNIRQNQACRELFGIERDEEVIGKYNIFQDDEAKRQGFMPLIEEAFSKGKMASFEIDYDFRKVRHIKVPGATHKILDVTIFPIKDANGKVTNVVVQHKDITESKQAEEALKQSSKQLRNLSAHLESVREEERTAIAREIHDELGQSLTALKMDLSWLSKRLPKEQESLVQKTTLMSGLINSTIQTVKRISTDLRPGLLDDIGIVAAIEWQAREFQGRTGIKCRLSIDPEDFVIDKNTTTTIFRIFQEALTNAYRHANATRLSVSLKRKANKLALKIGDNGKGITEEQISDPKSFGLMGMRERASYHGGEVKIRGISGKGTVLTLIIPVGKGELDDKNTRC